MFLSPIFFQYLPDPLLQFWTHRIDPAQNPVQFVFTGTSAQCQLQLLKLDTSFNDLFPERVFYQLDVV
ncbi:MAG: hypothetical protein ABFD98_08255 [Syntrophobacteraceae bacterium]|nr:hypothetical protein [Desulfobacteraceae bacterium]